MGVLSKTITKPHDLKSIKPQLVKLIKIKIYPHDFATITSRVEVTIKTKPAQDKDFVNDETLVSDPRPDYVFSFAFNSPSRLTRSRFSSKRRCRQQVCLKDSVIIAHLYIFILILFYNSSKVKLQPNC